MNKQVNIEGFENQKIEIRSSFWSGAKLLVNGNPAEKGKKRGEMLLKRNDGQQVTASWKAQFMGLDFPQLIVDGKTVQIVQPLKWYQWLWGGWPIFFLFVGGLLGALAGVVSVTINAKVFRTDLNEGIKYLISGIIAVLAVVAYFVSAFLLSMIVYG